jgi:hypothetical protein
MAIILFFSLFFMMEIILSFYPAIYRGYPITRSHAHSREISSIIQPSKHYYFHLFASNREDKDVKDSITESSRSTNSANSFSSPAIIDISIRSDDHSRTNQFINARLQLQQNVEELELRVEYLKEQLLESERSWFPIRSRSLREQLRQALDNLRRAEDEKRKAREDETLLFLELDDDNSVEDLKLSRKRFELLQDRRTYLFRIYNEFKRPTRVMDFDDIIPGELYSFKGPKTNFDSWAEIEAQIQTRDVVQSILRGYVALPPFDKNGTTYSYEPKIYFPDYLKPEFKEFGFGPPFNPDAWLIHGSSWCFVECKHSATTFHLRLFDTKIKKLRPYMSEPWFLGNRTPPTQVVGIICSIASFPAAQADLNFTRIVSSGRSYELVVITA